MLGPRALNDCYFIERKPCRFAFAKSGKADWSVSMGIMKGAFLPPWRMAVLLAS